MTNKTKILAAVMLLFFAGSVFAADINGMSQEQLQAYIDSLESRLEQSQQPQIITISPDAELRKTLDMLTQGMEDLRASNERLKENFAKLVSDTQLQQDSLKENIVKETSERTQAIADAQTASEKEYIQTMTNPVRLGLPIVAIIAIFTGAFLLWTSRLYGKGE
jgi:hypothetical protein